MEPATDIQAWAGWVAAAIAIITSGFLARVLYVRLLSDGEFINTFLRQHVRAIIGVPLSALTAFCVVSILQATSGHIEFSALTFQFKGASGPVVLWVMCFLSMILGIRALW